MKCKVNVSASERVFDEKERWSLVANYYVKVLDYAISLDE